MVQNNVQIINRKIGLPTRSVFKDLSVIKRAGGFAVSYQGRNYDYASASPVLAKILARSTLEYQVGSTVFGPTPPNAFVGEYGYPSVTAGPLVSVAPQGTDAAGLDDPRNWLANPNSNPDYASIISLRSALVRGKRQVSVKAADSKFSQDLREAVLSTSTVDIEMKFAKPPSFSLYFSPVASPSGPSGQILNFRLAGNPKIPNRVDELIDEKLKVSAALPELLHGGFEVYYIQKLLSAGVLGANPSLVPTKWSITATDDLVAKEMLKQVRDNPSVNEVQLYSNTALGNHFEIMFAPGAWEFEQFEAWHASTPWAQMSSSAIVVDYEPFTGRTKYAENEGGGYYAGRLGCVEKLLSMRKQARVVVFREIGEEYSVPLGVAQVRENARAALRKTPLKFQSISEALAFLSSRLSRPIAQYVKKSRVLAQSRLTDY